MKRHGSFKDRSACDKTLLLVLRALLPIWRLMTAFSRDSVLMPQCVKLYAALLLMSLLCSLQRMMIWCHTLSGAVLAGGRIRQMVCNRTICWTRFLSSHQPCENNRRSALWVSMGFLLTTLSLATTS